MAATHPDPGHRWEDEEALRSLSTAYATAVDGRDGDGLAALFVDNGALVVPAYPDDLSPTRTRTGPEALRRVAAALERYHRTFHQVSNHRFTVGDGGDGDGGDDAEGEVLCTAHHLTLGDGPGDGRAGTDTVWFIRYRDRYRRTDDGWRFIRRELHLQWVEEHSVAVVDAPDAVPAPD